MMKFAPAQPEHVHRSVDSTGTWIVPRFSVSAPEKRCGLTAGAGRGVATGVATGVGAGFAVCLAAGRGVAFGSVGAGCDAAGRAWVAVGEEGFDAPEPAIAATMTRLQN